MILMEEGDLEGTFEKEEIEIQLINEFKKRYDPFHVGGEVPFNLKEPSIMQPYGYVQGFIPHQDMKKRFENLKEAYVGFIPVTNSEGNIECAGAGVVLEKESDIWKPVMEFAACFCFSWGIFYIAKEPGTLGEKIAIERIYKHFEAKEMLKGGIRKWNYTKLLT